MNDRERGLSGYGWSRPRAHALRRVGEREGAEGTGAKSVYIRD